MSAWSDLRVSQDGAPPVFVFLYGLTADLTVRTMYASLSKRTLGLSYDRHYDRFTILGSASFKKEEIEKIFAENAYRGWIPRVLNELEKNSGEHLVKLVPMTKIQNPTAPAAPSWFFPYRR